MKEFFRAFKIYKQKREIYDWNTKRCKTLLEYPPITSDIVLNLFKIILDNGKDLLFTRDTDNRYLVRKNVVMRELDWHSGNNIQDIILSFCIEYKNELFDDVRALFNAR